MAEPFKQPPIDAPTSRHIQFGCKPWNWALLALVGALLLGTGCEPSQTAQLPPAKAPTLAPPWQLAPPQDPGGSQATPGGRVDPGANSTDPGASDVNPLADDQESQRSVQAKNPLIKGLGQLAASVPIDDENRNQLLDSMESADEILTEIKSENQRALEDLNRQVQLKSDSHPHIVLVLCDELPLERFAAYGGDSAAPNLDRVAAEGVVFQQFYAGGATPESSFWTLMTGKDTSRLKGEPELTSGMNLANMLWKAGYQTGFVGHWPIGVKNRQHGFDEWFGVAGSDDPHFPQYVLSGNTRVGVPKNVGGKQGVFADELYIEEAISILKRRDSRRPLFLVISLTSPAAAHDLGVADIAVQLASKLDRNIARIDEELTQQRMQRSTAFCVTSLTSPSSGQTGLRGAPDALYEGGLRVPMILRWPVRVRGGVTVDEPFAMWDMLKTFSQLSGALRLPSGMDGSSAMRYFAPGRHGIPKTMKRLMYWERSNAAGKSQAVRMGEWKVVRPPGQDDRDSVELYNLTDDPEETSNVAKQFPRILDAFLRDK